jgi:hypothetical protein
MTVARRSPVLVVGIVVGLILGAAEIVGGGPPWRVAISTLIPVGWASAVTVLGRRDETMGVLAGQPVDERAVHMNLEASAVALGITAVAVLAAFVVAEATHGDWAPYAFTAVVMAGAYVGSLVVLRVRG